MGYGRDTAPNMDNLARHGVCFDWAITQASNTISMFSMITGCELSEFAQSNYLTEGLYLEESQRSLVASFNDNGYKTAAIVRSSVLRAESGLAQGFDYYNDFSSSARRSNTKKWTRKIAADVTDAAITWLSRKREQPFFLWLHYFDPHHPYDPPYPYDGLFTSDVLDEGDQVVLLRNKAIRERTRFFEEINLGRREISGEQLGHIIDLYDGEIAYTDKGIGRLLDGMKNLGHFDNTLIIITADHREEFLDHGGMLHTRTLYDEVIHIPLLFYWPHVFPQGKRIESQACIHN
jgi:arylsulfatase A-like enzyme